MRQARKNCLFGGTFDPVHKAHLQIADEAQKRFGLDRVLFVPAANPPHKDSTGLTSFEDRFQMVQLACEPYPAFWVSRLEEAKTRSYTVETLERFRQKMAPEDELYFLIGSDAFDELKTWQRWREVVVMTQFIVASRPGQDYQIPEGARVHRLDGLDLPVASSTIRTRLAAGQATPELPDAVRHFIDAHGLYGSHSSTVGISK